MSLIRRLDDIHLLCSDIDAMAAFYHGTLGLPFLFPFAAGDNWFAVKIGDATLFFFIGRGDHPAPFVDATRTNPPGIESLYFAVDDLDRALREFEDKVDWIGDVREWRHSDGTWYRFRAFRDPEGNKICLTEPHVARSQFDSPTESGT